MAAAAFEHIRRARQKSRLEDKLSLIIAEKTF